MKTVIAAAALLALAACASPAPEPAPLTADASQAVKQKDTFCAPDTGTRLKRCADERLLRRIGTRQAQDDANQVQSISNTTGARSN